MQCGLCEKVEKQFVGTSKWNIFMIISDCVILFIYTCTQISFSPDAPLPRETYIKIDKQKAKRLWKGETSHQEKL